MEPVSSTDQQTITLPDFDAPEALQGFLESLRSQTSRHGVKRLLEAVEKVIYHKRLIADWTERIDTALQVVNGIRTPLQVVGDKERVWTKTAQTFFESLSEKRLRREAEFYGLEPVDRWRREEIIEMLVDMYVADKREAVLNTGQLSMFDKDE